MRNKNIFKKAFIASVPVLSGYIALGMAFGILLKNAGYGFWWCFAMSLFIYAGSMQYIAITLITGGASLISAAVTTSLVNARHLFYGISMIEKYNKIGAYKPYLIFALTDETYSLVCHTDKDTDNRYYLYVSFLNHLYWVTGSLLGSVAGSFLTFDTTGIDFVMTALFVVIVTEQWISAKKHTPAVIGFLCSAVCLAVFGAANFLIPSMIAILISLSFMKKRLGEEDE